MFHVLTAEVCTPCVRCPFTPSHAAAVCIKPPGDEARSKTLSARERDQIATITGAGDARRATRGAGEAGEDNDAAEETDAADFANYFYSYAELDHQKQMLEDER